MDGSSTAAAANGLCISYWITSLRIGTPSSNRSAKCLDPEQRTVSRLESSAKNGNSPGSQKNGLPEATTSCKLLATGQSLNTLYALGFQTCDHVNIAPHC